MKLFNTIAASVAVAMAVGVANADVNSQLASLQAQVNQLQAQVNGANGSSMAGMVGVNSNLSWQMMGNQAGVGKEMTLLQARQAGLNTPVTLGGFAQADAMYTHSNNNGQFFNQAVAASAGNSTSATQLYLSNADLATTAAIGSWATAYVQVGVTNLGDTTASALNIQDGYVVIGNLAKNPVFGFAGKKDIDFGSFATVDAYGAPLTRQLFSETGNTAGVGVNAYGFNGVVSVMNGGSSTTVSPSNGGFTTDNPIVAANNNLAKNFAVNLGYGMSNSGVNWNVGAGYVYATQFGSTSNAGTGRNGAWDLNGKVSVAGFDILAEFDMTSNQSYGLPGYYNAATSSSRVNAWSLGADYNFPVMGLSSRVSAEYSQAKLNGTAPQPKQVVIGYGVQPVNNVWTTLEYTYNKGLLTALNSNNATNNSTVLLDVSAAF